MQPGPGGHPGHAAPLAVPPAVLPAVAQSPSPACRGGMQISIKALTVSGPCAWTLAREAVMATGRCGSLADPVSMAEHMCVWLLHLQVGLREPSAIVASKRQQ